MKDNESPFSVIGVSILCLLLGLSCMESADPTEPPHPEVPAAPAMTAPDISTTGAYILRWSNVAGAVGFVLEEDLSTDFGAAYTAYSGLDTTIRFTGKQEGYIYYYRVRAYNANGSGPWSDLHAVRVIRGVYPQILVSPDTLDFGTVTAGQGELRQLTISNNGSAGLTVASATIDDPRYMLETVLPLIVRPGTSANLDVRFVPNAAGTATGGLTVFSNDEDDYPPVIVLRGEGV